MSRQKKPVTIAKRYHVKQELDFPEFDSLLICEDEKTGREAVLGVAKWGGATIARDYPPGKSCPIRLDRPCELKVKFHFKHKGATYVVFEKKKRYIGKYELLCERDKGAMGVIYKVKYSGSSKVFALKEIGNVDEDSLAIKRILQESYILEKLNHRYILKVHETLLWKGDTYILMDYVTGENLGDLIERGPVAPKLALQCIKKVAQALAYIHKADIIHRDIKPDNIMLDDKFDPKLMDFGIAKVLRIERPIDAMENIDMSADFRLAQVNLTVCGQMVGTPRYMAPELIKIFVNHKAEYQFDKRIDIFALGVTLAEMLLGEYPFSKKNNLSSLFWSIATAPVPQIPDDGQGGTRAINHLLENMLAKEPEQRSPNMDAVVREIEKILQNFKLKTSFIPEKVIREKQPVDTVKRRGILKKSIKTLAVMLVVTVILALIAKIYFPHLLPKQWLDYMEILLKRFVEIFGSYG